MALTAGDWTVDRQTGNIRYSVAADKDHNGASPSYATVIEFHRWLQGLADNASSTASDDELDITDNTPSARSTDNIITLNAPYNIDDASSEHLYDGSVIQNGGDDIYDGFVNFGNATVQIQVLQDGSIASDDWWNKSVGGTATAGTTATVMEDSGETWTVDGWIGYTVYNTTTGAQGIITENTADTITADMVDDNGGSDHDWDSTDTYLIGAALNPSSGSGISHRFMLKTRTSGVDIDGRRLIGLSRRYGNTYSEFKVNGTARGNNVFALSDATDLNNSTSGQDVQTWDQFANDNEGYFGQDVDNNTTNEYYYSNWDIGGGATPASPTINDLYEYSKYITDQLYTTTMYGIAGNVFRGITLQIPVDTGGGTFIWTEPEAVSWTGGTGQLLAVDDTDDDTSAVMWIQLLTGVAPADGLVITGGSSGASNAVNGTYTDRESLITKPFIGASTGSSIIGGYGVNVDSGDLTASDILFDLYNSPVYPPNNVTVSVTGLISTEDYVQVAQRGYRFAYDALSGGSFAVGDTVVFSGAITATGVVAEDVASGTTGYMIVSEEATGSYGSAQDNAVMTVSGVTAAVNGNFVSDIDKRQLILDTGLTADNITAVICTTAIPTDTPSTGIARVQDDDGYYRRLVYTSYTSATFTIDPAATDGYDSTTATDSDFVATNATASNNVYVGYIDRLSTTTPETFTAVYDVDRNLFVRVRDGGGTPIKTAEGTVTMSSSGGTSPTTRTTDL